MAKGNQYYVPLDASERILESGRPLTPGDTVKLSADDLESKFNKRLIDEGQLISLDDIPKAEKPKSDDGNKEGDNQ